MLIGSQEARTILRDQHDIGLEVHDSGLGLGMHKNILKQGMVLSDEPGIYVQGFGGVRIEDDVLVTKDGARFL